MSFPVVAGGSALIFAASASVLSPFAMAALGFVGLGEAFCIKFYKSKYVCTLETFYDAKNFKTQKSRKKIIN